MVGVVTPPQLMPVVASCRRRSHERHNTCSRTTVGPLTRGKSHQRAAHTRLRPLIGRWQTLLRVAPHELVRLVRRVTRIRVGFVGAGLAGQTKSWSLVDRECG